MFPHWSPLNQHLPFGEFYTNFSHSPCLKPFPSFLHLTSLLASLFSALPFHYLASSAYSVPSRQRDELNTKMKIYSSFPIEKSGVYLFKKLSKIWSPYHFWPSPQTSLFPFASPHHPLTFFLVLMSWTCSRCPISLGSSPLDLIPLFHFYFVQYAVYSAMPSIVPLSPLTYFVFMLLSAPEIIVCVCFVVCLNHQNERFMEERI